MISLQRIHHVVYLGKYTKETARFYKDILHLDLLVCLAEDRVPSTNEAKVNMHIFLYDGM